MSKKRPTVDSTSCVLNYDEDVADSRVAPHARDWSVQKLHMYVGEHASAVEKRVHELTLGLMPAYEMQIICILGNAHRDPHNVLICSGDVDGIAQCRGGTEGDAIAAETERRRSSVRALVQERVQRMAAVDDTSSSMLRCGRCGGTDVSWDSKQLRSADEGMTIFVQCENITCRARWKM